MAAEPVRIDLLQFMSLRQAATVGPSAAVRDLIRDDARGIAERDDLRDAVVRDQSEIVNMVVQEVFCTETTADETLVQKVLDTLPQVTVACDGPSAGLYALDELASTHRIDDDSFRDGSFRVLPDRLVTVLDPADADRLARIRTALLDAAAGLDPPEPPAARESRFDLEALVKSVDLLLQEELLTFVFKSGGLSPAFKLRKRVLFDALYVLYVLRRRIAVDLDEIIGGLETLHALEWIAVDRFLADAAGRLDALAADEQRLLDWLEGWLPELQPHGLLRDHAPALVDSRAALRRLLEASPVVHPIFAQLYRFRRPFNLIRPVGIGDLKVVKQWLVEYLPGEISHITNVLKGESHDRQSRTLERTQDVISFTAQTTQETSTDTQTTDHLELKREVESTVKSDLSLKVDSSVSASYSAGWSVAIGASAGFAFSRSAQEASKTAQQFAHDVVSKAVSKVQTQSSQTRSQTKTVESEEIVKHGVDNSQAGSSHVNGFYRFVDKRYKAQLYNFGKRLMFEFIVPEPAGFLVESRLRSFEGGTDVPTKPAKPTLETVSLGFAPTNIDKAKWQELRTTYDLSGLPPYPAPKKTIQLVDRETRSPLFAKYDLQEGQTRGRWWPGIWTITIDLEGYEVSKLMPTGNITFLGASGPDEAHKDKYVFLLNGTRVISPTEDADGFVYLQSPGDDYTINPPIAVEGGALTLTFEALNLHDFALTFTAELTLSADGLLAWQTEIYNAVRLKAQELADAENREALIQYQSDLGDYHRALKALAGTAVNSLLQGESSTANRRTVDRELRRHCLAELSLEFDFDQSNDTVSGLETVDNWDVAVSFEKMKVEESVVDGETVTTFGWEPEPHQAHYPATKLPEARLKGNMVQFLEQAFDWDNLSYLFYPYFWATPPKWIDLMNRSDDADPFYSAFLQAGSARVLVSVAPGYEHAVMHYLATRQPWDGGSAPVIGDPLFVAVYQELRNQQDNLAAATPEGDPWEFVLPTSLTYIDGGDPLPTFPQDAPGG